MKIYNTARYHRLGLIVLLIVLGLLSLAMVQGGCNDFVPTVDPFPPGGFIGGPSPFPQTDPNQGSPCPFATDSGTGGSDPFAPGGFIGGLCPFPQTDPNQGTPCPFPADSGTGGSDPFAPGGFIGGPCPFPQTDPNQGTPCPFSSTSTTGPTTAIQAVANNATSAHSSSVTSGSAGSSGGSGSSSGSTSDNTSGSLSGGHPAVIDCPFYPSLNNNPTASQTPAPTIVPQPVLKPVPQEPGPVTFTATGWSNITYKMPTDPNHDGLYEDLNGDGKIDFKDVILLFQDMEWIQANEPIQYFDFDGDHLVTFKDVITIFKEIP